MKRSDLICENSVIKNEIYSSSVHDKEKYGTRYTDIILDRTDAERSGVSQGRYTTVFTGEGDVKHCLAYILSVYLTGADTLVAGLGNINICSDSVGIKSLRHIPATAHLSAHEDFNTLGIRKVYVLETGVTGKTGIESSEHIRSIARTVDAGCVVVIDSLACSDIERLCTTIQITDTGISPGSGVGNDRKALNIETVGVPVIAVGVPTVIDLDCITDDPVGNGFMVTPRNIDLLTDRMAETVGTALSLAMNPELSEQEIRSFLIL